MAVVTELSVSKIFKTKGQETRAGELLFSLLTESSVLLINCLIPDGVIKIFHRHNLKGRIMALGSTQPLKVMSTRNISLGEGGGQYIGLTT